MRRATCAGLVRVAEPRFQSTPSLRRATIAHHVPSGLGLDFNPRPPCGGRRHCQTPRPPLYNFNPRPPCGGRHYSAIYSQASNGISIHALLAEGDISVEIDCPEDEPFQSTPSLRRATPEGVDARVSVSISIHALLAEGDQPTGTAAACRTISIHALLAEGDGPVAPVAPTGPDFNPRPPCGGRRFTCCQALLLSAFQSTPSLRRATAPSAHPPSAPANFNPRPPCGGRLQTPLARHPIFRFQSTPSLRRATSRRPAGCGPHCHFNPRPPCGGRLRRPGPGGVEAAISIHALLAEGDAIMTISTIQPTRFQSTPSLRRATSFTGSPKSFNFISIHALLAEGDRPSAWK